MTTTRYFAWTDAGAPTLSGSAGSLIALLKMLLVGNVDGVAYGTGSGERLAAGMEIAFEDSGAHKIVFRNSMVAGGSGCYIRIVDDGSHADGARVAVMQVYESMSDIDTGTNPALPADTLIRKSEDLSTAARCWIVGADERTFYLSTYTNAGTAPTPGTSASARGQYCALHGAGDFDAIIPGDPGIFCGGMNVISGSWLNSTLAQQCGTGGAVTTAQLGTTRGANLSAAATTMTPVCLALNYGNNIGLGGSSSFLPAVSAGTDGQHFAPIYMLDSATAIRGRLRGLLAPLNELSATTHIGDVVHPLGTPLARELAMCVGYAGVAPNNVTPGARVGIETTLSWDL